LWRLGGSHRRGCLALIDCVLLGARGELLGQHPALGGALKCRASNAHGVSLFGSALLNLRNPRFCSKRFDASAQHATKQLHGTIGCVCARQVASLGTLDLLGRKGLGAHDQIVNCTLFSVSYVQLGDRRCQRNQHPVKALIRRWSVCLGADVSRNTQDHRPTQHASSHDSHPCSRGRWTAHRRAGGAWMQ
jgi:hypothetical protein